MTETLTPFLPEPALAAAVFESGAAGAPYVKYKRTAFLQPGAAPVAFSLALVEVRLEAGFVVTIGAAVVGVAVAVKLMSEPWVVPAALVASSRKW